MQPRFNLDGKVAGPIGWRRWAPVGTALTPHVLNGGAALFPPFRNVHVEPGALAHFPGTRQWPEGTQIARTLVSVARSPNGKNHGVSARG